MDFIGLLKIVEQGVRGLRSLIRLLRWNYVQEDILYSLFLMSSKNRYLRVYSNITEV